MASQQDKGKEPLMGDVGGQDYPPSMEDRHFDVVNERGDHNSDPGSNIHDATKALLAEEAGKRAGSVTNPSGKPVSSTTTVNMDPDQDQDSGNKRKRTESPDSEIVVINDDGENQSIGSGLESDIEDTDSDIAIREELQSIKEYDPRIDDNLPETVTLLLTPDGGKLYLVGTAHFSIESQNDVSKIIQAVQPHIVMVELCKARVHILQLDEKTILQEAKNLNFESIRNTIQQNGLLNGLMYILLLNMSAHLTKELGMAPGGEFRRAFAEAKQVPNCLVHMGDRPINITIQRALSSLTWWQTLKLGWHLLTCKEPISREEVERCKRRDLLEEMLAEMTGEFPALGEVFVKERDLYLTHSLQLACLPQRTSMGLTPARVVGVVGIGHIPGIAQHWGKVKPSEIPPILRIPPPSLSSKILRLTVKASLVGAVIFVGYKVIPVSSIQSFKSSVEGLWKMEAQAREDEYEHIEAEVMYVVTNIPGPGADLEEFESVFANGCTCRPECTRNCSCARGFNYNNGHILEEKLAGPVIECNARCQCDANCGNRLVQRGPLDSLVIASMGQKGYGLRTTKLIRKGKFICEYAGEVIGVNEAEHRIDCNKRDNSMNYVLIVSEHLSNKTIKTCIDPKFFGNIGRYCNHSCEANASLLPVRVEGIVPRLCLFASRDIEGGEEVTFDYAGGEANSVHNLSQTPCLCGSANCLRYLPHHPV